MHCSEGFQLGAPAVHWSVDNNHWTCPQIRPLTLIQSPRHCLLDRQSLHSFLRFGQQQTRHKHSIVSRLRYRIRNNYWMCPTQLCHHIQSPGPSRLAVSQTFLTLVKSSSIQSRHVNWRGYPLCHSRKCHSPSIRAAICMELAVWITIVVNRGTERLSSPQWPLHRLASTGQRWSM